MIWVVIIAVLLALIGYAIYGIVRIRTGQTLRLIAGMMQRGMPLETGLLDCVSSFPKGEERNVRDVGLRMANGKSLPEALSLTGMITVSQRLALELAIERGGAIALMKDFADDRIRVDKGWLRHYIIAYPMLIGAAVTCLMLYGSVFIFPKFRMMFREMDIGADLSLDFVFYAAIFPLILIANIAFIASLMIRPIANVVWLKVPLLGRHVRDRAQADLCALFATLLHAGVPLEDILDGQSMPLSRQPYRREMGRALMDIRNGAPPAEAFGRHGPRGEEFKWAMHSLSQGVAPKQAFSHVADLLYARAYRTEDRLYRCCAALTLILASVGVGAFAYVIFEAIVTLQKGMI
jgi:type II secretory pathway component PulF